MKKNLEHEITTRYARYLAQIKSYCEVVGMEFVAPTITQFLAANARTRDRLLGDAPATKQVVETNKRHGLLSFACHVKGQGTSAIK